MSLTGLSEEFFRVDGCEVSVDGKAYLLELGENGCISACDGGYSAKVKGIEYCAYNGIYYIERTVFFKGKVCYFTFSGGGFVGAFCKLFSVLAE